MADLKTKGGVKLTKQAVDRMAKEAEKGYDLSKAKAEGRTLSEVARDALQRYLAS